MPFLAYLAIILVSLGGILFEVNWLTSPKLETKPAVQASAPTPKVAAVTAAPTKELNEDVTEPKADTPAGPRNVAPTVTMVPGGATTPKAPETKAAEAKPSEAVLSPVPTLPSPPQQTASAPPITSAPAFSAAETTGTGSLDFKREFSTDAKADGATSSATFTPAITTPAAAATATPAVALSPTNKCDIAACSAAYQSFRAADCSYQPMDGTARKACDRTQGGAQQASAPVREYKSEAAVRTDAARKPNKESGLRAFEREVRRITASEAALDAGNDRGYERAGRSQVIVIERRDW
jgi:hypothetical protein